MITRVVAVAGSPGVLAAVTEALRRSRDLRLCGAGADQTAARDLIREHRPDVVILGLDLAGGDGLVFLDRLMKRFPLPVVALAEGDARGSRRAVRALELGALEALDSWRLCAGGDGPEVLRGAVRAARGAREGVAFRAIVEAARRRRVNALADAHHSIVAIGASTGGTEALHSILPVLPKVTPGILVTQHLPAGFTAAFASRLNRDCQMEVREAAHGDRIHSGLVLIAPGDRHLRVRRGLLGLEAALDEGPPVNRHRPSVDVLFRSVAEVCGADSVGVILTGMGADGAAGLREMRERGASTIAQDEQTCVVYGMPREAVARGAAERVLPLDRIPPAVLLAVLRKTDARRPALRTA